MPPVRPQLLNIGNIFMRNIHKASLVAVVAISVTVFSLQWLVIFISPEMALALSIPYIILLISAVAFGFKSLFAIPENAPKYKRIRTLALYAPAIGIIVGIYAFWRNDFQAGYLFWYPLCVTLGLEIILGIWAKKETNKYMALRSKTIDCNIIRPTV